MIRRREAAKLSGGTDFRQFGGSSHLSDPLVLGPLRFPLSGFEGKKRVRLAGSSNSLYSDDLTTLKRWSRTPLRPCSCCRV